MKITIKIPREFEEHFNNDRFIESLYRLKSDAHCLAGLYEKELVDMMITAFTNAQINSVYEVRCCPYCIAKRKEENET